MSAPNPLAEACSGRPFSNGTEGDAWMSVWCSRCVHDHGAHDETYTDCCDLIAAAMLPDFPSADLPWPEVWLPEPDGSFSLPSRMTCGQFSPCTNGDCTGDDLADTRAAIVSEVTVYWRDRAAGEAHDGRGGNGG